VTQKAKGKTGLKTLFEVGAFRVCVRPDSTDTYQVVGPRLPGEPRRTRKSYKTEDEARAKAVEFDGLLRKHKLAQKAPDMRMAPTRLDLKRLKEAESIFDLVQNDPRSAGRSLTELVQAGLGTRAVRSAALEVIIEAFLAAKKNEELEVRSYQSLDSVLHMFGASQKTLTLESVRSFVGAKGFTEAGEFRPYSSTTRRNRRTQIGQLVRWAAAEAYIPEDFMDRVKAPKNKDDVSEIVTITPQQARTLLDAARKVEGGCLWAYVLLATWAGVRPGELERLQPDQIDLERGVVEVGRPRTPTHRFHRLAPLAVYWLRREEDLLRFLPVPPTSSAGFRSKFAKVRGAAGLFEDWVEDTLRHTYISHGVPLFGAEGIAPQAGNSVIVIHRHYRKPKHAEDVADFWLSGFPAGEKLCQTMTPREAEAWMKTPNPDLHGIRPMDCTLEGFQVAVDAVVAREKDRRRDSRR